MAYQRVLLKISGAALKGSQDNDILDSKILKKLALTIKKIHQQGVDLGIVIGGGNIWRGRVAKDFGLDRESADYMGMTATIINSLVLKDVLKSVGVPAEALSALPIKGVIEKYSAAKANRLIDERHVVIFGGGTGKPFLSTDTAAAMRARDIKAEIILAGKDGVEGVYDSDPDTNPKARFLAKLSYDEFLDRELKALDLEAIALCKKHQIPIRVFNVNNLENIVKVVNGSTMGSYIGKEK
ncbi:UMP kinase [bacterium]|nr:UMP kinase [bacterium]